MKGLKLSLMVLAATLLAFGLSGMAYAFHAGGVAECGGCHSMHSPKVGGTFLLIGIDQSSTCLSCHEHAGDTAPSSYHISTAVADMPDGVPPLQRGPGGDFGWIKKTYTFTQRGAAVTEQGYTHGHNIVAGEKGYTADPVNTVAPGGTYSASNLSCVSCHNMHGKYRRLTGNVIATAGAPIYASGSYFNPTNGVAANEPTATEAVGVYRLLHGGTEGGVDFPGAPVAKVPSTYNRKENATQTRVAYGNGTSNGNTTFGNWCAACHPGMHSSGNYVHPIDQSLGSTIKGIYDTYVKSGDMSGNNATAFTSLVPFAEASQDYAAIAPHAVNNDTYLNGPGSSDKVMCLSCHRAHASGWEFGLKWNMEGTFITIGGVYPGKDTTPNNLGDARGRTGAETQAAYYDRPATKFATYQRVLCNKCHAKD